MLPLFLNLMLVTPFVFTTTARALWWGGTTVLVGNAGGDAQFAVLLALPAPLLAALSFLRYFLDSQRGYIDGFLNLIFDCASTPKEILTGLYFFQGICIANYTACRILQRIQEQREDDDV